MSQEIWACSGWAKFKDAANDSAWHYGGQSQPVPGACVSENRDVQYVMGEGPKKWCTLCCDGGVRLESPSLVTHGKQEDPRFSSLFHVIANAIRLLCDFNSPLPLDMYILQVE